MNPAPEVLYVAGCGRSGSTLLDNIIGQLEGCFSCGELWHVWRRGLIENRLCSDGPAFREHPFWREVFDLAFGGMERISAAQAEAFARAARSLLVSRRYPQLALGQAPDVSTGLAAYRDALLHLYAAIAAVSGARVLVDSSKSPVYAACLASLPGMRLRVLQVVRDPRAVAHSWARHREQPDKRGKMDRHGAMWSVLHWRLANAAARALGERCGLPRYLLRYEDFVRAPRVQLRAVLDWMGHEGGGFPFSGDERFVLRPGVAFAGNPGRFRTGLQALRPDEEWRSALPAMPRLLVEALAGPDMRRYGYAANAPPPSQWRGA